MADRFFASYEDDFNSRPNSGRERSSILPNVTAPARRSAAPEPHWPEQTRPEQNWPEQNWPDQDWSEPHFQPDPNDWANDRPSRAADRHQDAYSAPAQPMFAPLDRRSSGQSYPAQPRYDRPEYDQSYSAQSYGAHSFDDQSFDPMHDDPRAQDAQDVRGKAQPAFGKPAYALSSNRIAKVTQWAGSICSVLVLLGAVYWAYELAVRDARGIPVVRAAEGPLRIAPATPGGEVSANQGLAVNSIAAKGGSEPLPDVLTLAPAPAQLAQEDVAETASVETASVETASVEAPALVEVTEASAMPDAAQTPEVAQPAADSALTDLATKTPDVMPISDEAAVEAALAMALSEGGEAVTKSNTDTAQPAELAVAAPKAAPASEVDPASVPAGTKLVQLGAFDNDALAREAWAGLQTQFADLIGSKSLIIQQAKSGGRVFYRLRAHGFADEDETRRFCAALLAENASCIPVSQR